MALDSNLADEGVTNDPAVEISSDDDVLSEDIPDFEPDNDGWEGNEVFDTMPIEEFMRQRKCGPHNRPVAHPPEDLIMTDALRHDHLSQGVDGNQAANSRNSDVNQPGKPAESSRPVSPGHSEPGPSSHGHMQGEKLFAYDVEEDAIKEVLAPTNSEVQRLLVNTLIGKLRSARTPKPKLDDPTALDWDDEEASLLEKARNYLHSIYPAIKCPMHSWRPESGSVDGIPEHLLYPVNISAICSPIERLIWSWITSCCQISPTTLLPCSNMPQQEQQIDILRRHCQNLQDALGAIELLGGCMVCLPNLTMIGSRHVLRVLREYAAATSISRAEVEALSGQYLPAISANKSAKRQRKMLSACTNVQTPEEIFYLNAVIMADGAEKCNRQSQASQASIMAKIAFLRAEADRLERSLTEVRKLGEQEKSNLQARKVEEWCASQSLDSDARLPEEYEFDFSNYAASRVLDAFSDHAVLTKEDATHLIAAYSGITYAPILVEAIWPRNQDVQAATHLAKAIERLTEDTLNSIRHGGGSAAELWIDPTDHMPIRAFEVWKGVPPSDGWKDAAGAMGRDYLAGHADTVFFPAVEMRCLAAPRRFSVDASPGERAWAKIVKIRAFALLKDIWQKNYPFHKPPGNLVSPDLEEVHKALEEVGPEWYLVAHTLANLHVNISDWVESSLKVTMTSVMNLLELPTGQPTDTLAELRTLSTPEGFVQFRKTCTKFSNAMKQFFASVRSLDVPETKQALQNAKSKNDEDMVFKIEQYRKLMAFMRCLPVDRMEEVESESDSDSD